VDQATDCSCEFHGVCHRPAQVRPKLECFGLDLTPPVLLSAFPLLHQIRFYPPQIIIIRLSRSVLPGLGDSPLTPFLNRKGSLIECFRPKGGGNEALL